MRGPRRTSCWRLACRWNTRCTCCRTPRRCGWWNRGPSSPCSTSGRCARASTRRKRSTSRRWTRSRRCGRSIRSWGAISDRHACCATRSCRRAARKARTSAACRSGIPSPTPNAACSDMSEAQLSHRVGAASRILAWVAHLYTATGAVIALLATAMTFAHNFRAALLYLVAATIVDATDGVLARAVRVKERLPYFDGALLDNLIDYLTYVFVPALIVWQADLVPTAFPICAAMCVSSLYGFSRTDAKGEGADHYFV